MQNTTNDMTRGNSMKLIFQFFLPILIGNLFQQLYSFVDSMVVGKGIGDTELAAVGYTRYVHFPPPGPAAGQLGGLCHRYCDHNVLPASDAAAVYLSADAGGYDDGYSRVFRNNPGRKHHHDFQ